MGPSAIARTIRTMTIRTISHTPMATMGEEVIADQMPAHTPCKIVGNGFAGEVGVGVGVGGILCSTTRVPRPISELAELCRRREIEIVATRGTADRRSSQPKLVRELPGRARRLLQRVRCRRQVGPADGIHLAAQPFADAAFVERSWSVRNEQGAVNPIELLLATACQLRQEANDGRKVPQVSDEHRAPSIWLSHAPV